MNRGREQCKEDARRRDRKKKDKMRKQTKGKYPRVKTSRDRLNVLI